MTKVGKPRPGRKPGTPRVLGSGRRKGTPNKATAEVKELARLHGPAAIEEAVRIMKTSESDQARLAAAREILDRAYGKPQQTIVGADDAAPVELRITWGAPQDARDCSPA